LGQHNFKSKTLKHPLTINLKKINKYCWYKNSSLVGILTYVHIYRNFLLSRPFNYFLQPPNFLYKYMLVLWAAMMAYKTVLSRGIVKKSIHMILHLIALCLGIVGICAVFKYHDMIHAEDVYSLHSWIGLVTFCLFCLQVREQLT
jgi:hypothetical protein